MPEHSAAYRTVACFASPAEADVARDRLAAKGIVAALRQAAGGGDAAASVRLLVPAVDLDRARAALAPAGQPPRDRAPPAAAADGRGGGWQAGLSAVALVLFAAAVAMLLSLF